MYQNNFWRTILEAASTVCVLLSLALGALAWRLSKGPVSFSTGAFERMFARALGASVHIEYAELVWNQAGRPESVGFRVGNLRIGHKGARVTAPRLYFQLSLPALMQGYLLPSKVSVPQLSVSLASDGERAGSLGWSSQIRSLLSQALLPGGAVPEVRDDSGTDRSALPTRPRRIYLPDFPQKYVSRVDIANISVSAGNKSLGRGDLHLKQPPDSVLLQASFEVTKTAQLRLTAKLNQYEKPGQVNVDLEVYPQTDDRKECSTWGIPINMHLVSRRQMGGFYDRAQIRARSLEPGCIRLPGEYPLNVDHFSLESDWLMGKDSLIIKSFRYESPTVRGAWSGRIDYDQNLAKFKANLAGNNIFLSLPSLFEEGVFADEAELQATLDLRDDSLSVTNLSLSQPFVDTETRKAFTTKLRGRARLAHIFRPKKETPLHLSIDSQADNLPASFLMQFWPKREGHFLPEVRKWITDHITEGIVKSATFTLDSSQKDMFRVAFDSVDTTLHYLDPLPPLHNARGSVVITQEGMDVHITHAQVENDTLIEDLHLRADFDEEGRIPARIKFNTHSSVATLGRMLYGKPLDILAENGRFDLRRGIGQVRGRAEISLPLGDPNPKYITFDVSGQTSDAALDGFYGQRVEQANLNFHAKKDFFSIKGPATLSGMPLNIKFSKELAGSQTTTCEVRGNLKEEDLRRAGISRKYIGGPGTIEVALQLRGNKTKPLTGTLNADITQSYIRLPEIGFFKPERVPLTLAADIAWQTPERPVQIRVRTVREKSKNSQHKVEDLVQLNGTLELDPNNGTLVEGCSVNLTFPREEEPESGSRLDTTNFYLKGGVLSFSTPRFDLKRTDLFSRVHYNPPMEDQRPGPEKKPLSEGALQTILKKYLATLPREVRVRVREISAFNNASFHQSELTLTRDSTAHFNLAFHSKLREKNRPVSRIMLSSFPYGQDVTVFSFVGQDGGALLRALNIYEYINEGKLRIQGIWDRRRNAIDAQLLMSNFYVHRLSLIAHILALASVSGIQQALSGRGGIYFEDVYAPFSFDSGTLTVRGGRMVGSSLGLTLSGTWSSYTDQLSLRGTIIPLYELNSFLGYIPFIGNFLIGRQGEGVFGIHYDVYGVSKEPDIRINPVSALTPGPLRWLLFDFLTGLEERNDEA